MSLLSAAEDESLRRKTAMIQLGPEQNAEALLAGFTAKRQAEGHKVGGILQESHPETHGMVMVDILTGERIRLDQNLGSGATSCVLDVHQLTHAAQSVRAALEQSLEILVINKFARQESLGQGLLQELFMAISAGIPVLGSVGPLYLPAWQEMSGGLSTLLTPTEEALEQWWQNLDETRPKTQYSK